LTGLGTGRIIFLAIFFFKTVKRLFLRQGLNDKMGHLVPAEDCLTKFWPGAIYSYEDEIVGHVLSGTWIHAYQHNLVLHGVT
jgi:hypothetical protein